MYGNVILNTTIVSYFKTGNPLIDSVILMSIATMTSYLFSKKHKLIKKAKKAVNNCLSQRWK